MIEVVIVIQETGYNLQFYLTGHCSDQSDKAKSQQV